MYYVVVIWSFHILKELKSDMLASVKVLSFAVTQNLGIDGIFAESKFLPDESLTDFTKVSDYCGKAVGYF